MPVLQLQGTMRRKEDRRGMIKDMGDIQGLPLWTIIFRYNRCRVLLQRARDRRGLLGGWDKEYLEAVLDMLQDSGP